MKVWKTRFNFLCSFTSMNTPGSNQLRDDVFMLVCSIAGPHAQLPVWNGSKHTQTYSLSWCTCPPRATLPFSHPYEKEHTHTQTVAHSQPHIDTSIFLILEFMNMKECCCAGDGFFRSSLSNNKSPTTPIMCSAPPAKQPRGPQWTQRYTHQSGILTHAW